MTPPSRGLAKPMAFSLLVLFPILLALILLTSGVISTPQFNENGQIIYTFHHQEHTADLIDFKTTQDDLKQVQLYIITVKTGTASVFGTDWSEFKNLIVDYLPDNMFIIHSSGIVLSALQQSAEHGDKIIAVSIVPPGMKMAKNISYYESAQKVTNYTHFVNKVTNGVISLNEKVQYMDRINSSSDLDEELSNFINLKNIKISNPKHIEMFNEILPPNDSILKTKPELNSILQNFFTSAPYYLNNFHNEFTTIVNKIDNNDYIGMENDIDPREIADMMSLDIPRTDPTTDSTGILSQTTPTFAILTSTVDHTVTDENDGQGYGIAFKNSAVDIKIDMDDLYQIHLERFTSSIRSTMILIKNTKKISSSTQNPYLNDGNNLNDSSLHNPQIDRLRGNALKTVVNAFIDADIDPEHFFSTLSEINHSRQSLTKSTTPHLNSILPLNTIIQHTRRPYMTQPESKIAMNTARVLYQSPLLMANQTALMEIISDRIHHFHTMVTQMDNIGVGLGLKHGPVEQNQDGSEKSSQKHEIFPFSTLKKMLSRHHLIQISSGLHLEAAFNRCAPIQLRQSIRAEAIQYIDTIILSLLESHYKTQFTSGKIVTGVQIQLDALSHVTSTLISHQIGQIQGYISETMKQLSHLPHVYSIEGYKYSTLFNGYARLTSTVGLEFPPGAEIHPKMSKNGPYIDAGINGEGIVVSVADTGLDTGSCFIHDDEHFVPYTGSIGQETKSDHRKVKSLLTLADHFDYLNGHGSHVAGSIVGSCKKDGMINNNDIHGGPLPNGKIAFVDTAICKDLVALLDFELVFDHAGINGALMTSNSWGSSPNPMFHPTQDNFYSSISRRMDAYLNNHQNLTALFAAGNMGKLGFGTLTQQGTSKNTVIVGSTTATKAAFLRYSSKSVDNPAWYSTPSSFDKDNIYGGTSSLGPTFDNRFGIEFASPGNQVFSIASSNFSIPTGTPSDYNVVSKSGTSMATPNLAGLFGTIQNMLQDGRINSGLPHEAHKYARESITGPLLRAIGMNAAQPTKYRADNTIQAPMPMKINEPGLPLIKYNGQNFFNLGSGEPLSMRVGDNLTARFFIRPTRNDKFITTTGRSFRVMIDHACPAMQVVITPYLGTDTEPDLSTPFVPAVTFPYEDSRLSSRTTLNIENVPVDKQLYLVYQFNTFVTACPKAQVVEFMISQFSHSKINSSQRFMDIDCDDTWLNFSPWVAPSWAPTASKSNFRCPPVPTCSTRFADRNVVGTKFYANLSSICASAIHAGVVNATNAQNDIIGPNGYREIVTTSWQSPYFDGSAIPPSVFNGVRSHPLPSGVAVEMIYTFEVGQEAILGIEDRPSNQSMLHLRRTPSGPNFISGFGRPQLSTVLPLTQHAIYPEGLDNKNSVQRQIAILSDGNDLKNITHSSSHSYCFTVSSKPLIDSYQYEFEHSNNNNNVEGIINRGTTIKSEIWTSGPDTARVSLAWYDSPSSTAIYNGRTLTNDLDLFVFSPDGSEYRGNQRADRLNNGERVSFDQGTFIPGMYCAVVNGANVPMGAQRYALVANGRGVEYCQANPFGRGSAAVAPTMSGEWSRGSVSCKASNWKNDERDNIEKNMNDDDDDDDDDDEELQDLLPLQLQERENHPTDIYTSIGSDPQTSPFHSITHVQIRQGGDCFSIHATTKSEILLGSSSFSNQRLSSNEFELNEKWDVDSIKGMAMIPSNSTFAISGKIVGEVKGNGSLSAELYNLVEPKNGDDHHRVEGNADFIVTGTFNKRKSLQIVVTGTKTECTYKYSRETEATDVHYNPDRLV